ncbi:MAG: hypothetical protein J4428_04515 [Candidatus Aenigmarchaeota archaeon]|nr:hypothetical protein [Candidatus Aenigmarchaeota archaeon]
MIEMADPIRFNEIIQIMRDSGYFGTLLPFLLVWSIIFGLLKKLNIFGFTTSGNSATGAPGQIIRDNGINFTISTIIAAYVVVFSPFSTPLNEFFSSFFTQSALAMVVLLVALLFVGLVFFAPFWGGDAAKLSKLMQGWIPWLLGLAIVGVGVIFVTSGGIELFYNYLPLSWRPFQIDPYWIALIIAAVLIIGTMLIASGGGGGQNP